MLSFTLTWPCYGIITNQSAAFDPHSDVGPVYIKTKCLQLRRDTLTRDLGSCTFEVPCNELRFRSIISPVLSLLFRMVRPPLDRIFRPVTYVFFLRPYHYANMDICPKVGSRYFYRAQYDCILYLLNHQLL